MMEKALEPRKGARLNVRHCGGAGEGSWVRFSSELIEAQDEYNRIQTEIISLKRTNFLPYARALADQRNVQRSF